jgi:hypothetical protein
MATRIFKNEEHQALFDKRGFIVLPFLNDEEVSRLDKFFDELHPSLPNEGGFVSGSYSNDFEYKKKSSEIILSVFLNKFENIFVDYQPFGAAFLYKLSNQGSELGAHQDWTIVDEENYVALNCWVPLTDTNENNGTLHVLPGSQYKNHKTLRAPTIPFFFTGNESEVIEGTIPFYVKAGQAVILNQSVIHYSPPNKSGLIRKAITAGVKSKNAPMIFHYKTEDNKLEKYHMPEDFLIRFEDFATSIFQKPKLGTLSSIEDFNNPVLEKHELTELLNTLKLNAGYKTKHSFFDKILSKLKVA